MADHVRKITREPILRYQLTQSEEEARKH